MSPKISSLWALPELDVEVVTLLQGEYGSSDQTALDELAGHLQQLLKRCPAGRLIVDISAVRYAGAGFVSVLAEFVAACRKAGRTLMLTGDRLGLLKITRLTLSVAVYPDSAAALATCPRAGLVWPSRFAMPLPLLNSARTDRFACRAD